VVVSSTNPEYSLTVAGSASSEYALTVMTIAAAIFIPIVLLYQGYTYIVLRRRVGGGPTAGEGVEQPQPKVPAE
jgi:cytochrome d ubiquinol oxidase subunit II